MNEKVRHVLTKERERREKQRERVVRKSLESAEHSRKTGKLQCGKFFYPLIDAKKECSMYDFNDVVKLLREQFKVTVRKR